MTTDIGPVPWWVPVNVVRYAIGRSTYAVQETVDWVIANWDKFSGDAREVIRRDLEEAFRRDDMIRAGGGEYYRPLGMDCDRGDWERVRALWTKSNPS
jgi:hypothetical protein